MTIREDVSNFKFFEVITPHQMDPSVAGVTGKTVDTQGYDALQFTLAHSVVGESTAGGAVLISVLDYINVYMEHASNSTTGVDTVGAWSVVTATDVHGFDYYNCLSDLTIDSWLALDELTRNSYPISVPARTGGVSGQFMTIGISTTSAASCLTLSHTPTVAYTGNHRWVRIMISASTDVSMVKIAAHALLTRPHQWPVTFAENV